MQSVGTSRWILPTLWLIAAVLLVGVVAIHGKGALTDPRLVGAQAVPNAADAFTAALVPAGVTYNLDVITASDHAAVLIKTQASVAVTAGTPVSIVGWAFDAAANAEYPAIGARVSGDLAVASAVVHLARPDVEAALRNPAARYSGFSLTIDTSHLAPGRHTVSVRALAPGRQSAALLEPALAIDIVGKSAALQNTDAIDTLDGVTVDAAASATSPVPVRRSATNGRLSISGWGFVTQGNRLPSGITLLVDGRAAAPAQFGLSRPDVAQHFGDPSLERCGFEGSLATASMPAGRHAIQLRLESKHGTGVASSTVVHIDLQR